MFVGNFDYSLWMNLDMKMWGDSGLPGLCFAAFQMTFAIIASAIISGSLVERMRFSAYSIMLALWSLLIYAPLCHWVWGTGGWIGAMGALDFAGGSTSVDSVAKNWVCTSEIVRFSHCCIFNSRLCSAKQVGLLESGWTVFYHM